MSKLIHIFEETACPSVEALEKYVHAKSNSQEQFAIEQHLLDCELCSDAIEGLKHIESSASLHARLKSLKDAQRKRLFRKVDKRQQVSKRQSRVQPLKLRPLYITSAAAAVVLFVSFYILTRSETSIDRESPSSDLVIAENQVEDLPAVAETEANEAEALTDPVDSMPFAMTDASPAEAESVPLEDGSTQAPYEPIASRDGPSTAPSRQPSLLRKRVQEPEVLAESKQSLAQSTIVPTDRENDEAVLGESNSDIQPTREESSLMGNSIVPGAAYSLAEPAEELENALAKELPPAVEEDTLLSSDEFMNSLSDDMDGIIDIAAKRKTAMFDDRDYRAQTKFEVLREIKQEGLEFYNAGLYQEAALKFEEILEGREKDEQVYFFLAKSYYELEDLKSALGYFRRVRNGASSYAPEASFMMAKVFLQKNRPKAARKELDKIIEANGKWAEEAKALLQTLDF